jgi:hypothetical protein
VRQIDHPGLDRRLPGRFQGLVWPAYSRRARPGRCGGRSLGSGAETPLIAGLVDSEVTQDRIDLTNGITIEISTANFGSVRGYTVVAGLCDEIAFLTGDDSANPDTEILAALRPTMTTMLPGALLLCASSPYAQRGALFDAYRKPKARTMRRSWSGKPARRR